MRDSFEPKGKMIDGFWGFLIALVCLGPLAIPLLWRNPRLSQNTKILGSVIILVVTGLALYYSDHFLANIRKAQEAAEQPPIEQMLTE